jgi:hypothetical protein
MGKIRFIKFKKDTGGRKKNSYKYSNKNIIKKRTENELKNWSRLIIEKGTVRLPE